MFSVTTGLWLRGMYFELTDRFVVSADLTRTWEFFSAAENLAAITPPWLRFEVRTPPPVRVGPEALLDYTIRWAGIPVRWRTKIIDWSPPRQFIDIQVRGPYALWLHQHTFREAEGGTGTECADRVVYALPVPFIGTIVHAAVVRRQLTEIFRYRRTVVAEHLGLANAVRDDVRIARL